VTCGGDRCVGGWEGTGQIDVAVVTNNEKAYPLTLSPLPSPSRSPETKRQVRVPRVSTRRVQVMMEKAELNTRGGH